MGTITIHICPKCGYGFRRKTGIGMMFPQVYQETVEKAKEGKFGKEIQDFFRDHPDGAIDAESVTLCCEACGCLGTDKDLTMYIPKKRSILPDIGTKDEGGSERSYVMRYELVEFYEKYADYPHKCGKCGGKMRVIDSEEELECPVCRVPLEMDPSGLIMWD